MTPPELPTPLETTTPPPARRFTRVALGLALTAITLLVTVTALVITSPAANRPAGNVAAPKEVRPADAAFLNTPPRRREEIIAPPNPELAALLRNARGQPSAPSGPFALGLPPTPSPSASPVDTQAAGYEEPPLGAYRPYPSPSTRLAPPVGASARPSWQAAFSSSLVSSSSAASSGPPAPPPFTPPPTLDSIAAASRPPATTTPSRLSSSVASVPRLVGPRSVPAGSILDAILLTAISTQTPGDAFAHISSDVRALDGSVVIPRGSKLIGTYANQVALGDHRIAVAWNRILLPGGRSTELAGLPSASPDGAAGLPGDVNNHSGLVFGRAALLSLISAASQLGQPRQSRVGANLSDGEVLAGSVSQQLTTAAAQLLNRAVDVTPTIFVPAGSRVTVLVPQDLDLR